MPARKTYRVENQRQEPVELHVAAEAVVLGPEDSVELTEITGQVEELARRGIVRIEQAAPPRAQAAATTPTSANPAARKSPAKKSPAAKRSPARRAAAKKAPTKKATAKSAPTRSRRGGN